MVIGFTMHNSFVRNLLVALALVLGLARYAAAQPVLHIAFPEYRPYFAQNQSGEMEGFFYEIITEALQRRLGVPLKWNCFPWARCQMMVRHGREDAMITVPTSERAEYTLTHKDPFYSKPLYLFTYVGHPRMPQIQSIGTIQDIRDLGLSVITYAGNGWNKQMIENQGIPSLNTPSLKAVWCMLAAKRGDLAIEWPESAWPDIRAQDLGELIVQTDVVVSNMPFHLLINKASPHVKLLPLFDDVIREMRRDGTMSRILARYGISDDARVVVPRS